MGWVDALQGALVGLDAAPLIYFAEEHPRYLPIVEPFFVALDHGACRAVASTVALLEVLVYPLRRNDVRLAETYRAILLHNTALTTLPVSAEIAELAAGLRANFTIRTPDALHVATARQMGATFFLTNDTRLPAIPGLTIVALDTLSP